MGADQFAHVVAVVGDTGWFVVRKERKGRGTNQLIEGMPLDASSRVVLVEDTVTTGGSIVKAFDAVIEESGAQVVAAVTICDRGDAAAEFFAGQGVPYFALVSYTDLGIEPVVAAAG
jgi:orotate phosphoribosyltransferase